MQFRNKTLSAQLRTPFLVGLQNSKFSTVTFEEYGSESTAVVSDISIPDKLTIVRGLAFLSGLAVPIIVKRKAGAMSTSPNVPGSTARVSSLIKLSRPP